MDRSLKSLWDQMHVRLCRFICSRIPDGDDAEDILQDVFMRIHTHQQTVREMDRLESWIYQVTRNAITDYYRERRRFTFLTDLPAETGDPQVDGDESLGPYVRQLVDALPEPYRQALVLADFEGISQQELADRAGISLSGAKSRVQRAREKIRAALLACCHAEFAVRGTRYKPQSSCGCCCKASPVPEVQCN